jgi:hypothetical protein
MNLRQRRAHARLWPVLLVLLLAGLAGFYVLQQAAIERIGGV